MLVPLPPADQWDDVLIALGTLLSAIAALIGALWSGWRTRAEVRQMHDRLNTETTPDHGSSLRDAIDRIERTQRGMARDVGRLADADEHIRSDASREHAELHHRIDRLEDHK
ncbi:hypothetical protein [Acidipropionibacterium timonense]|uniref:hypothetical protein n=1 Tax=Acidipropionibacterium timonense TaxID=2161818 RepID=UPI0010322EA1|nr:hypothetical protein [Acidipropionibacterium timonense]